jgi:diguanylate cyclase
MRAWPGAPASLTVNISVRELPEPGFAAAVAALLDDYGIAGERLTLELAEAAPDCAGALADLRGLGVRVSLDDFGTGPSALAVLQSCPVDELKLDRALSQAPGAAVAAGVLHLARAMGLRVVAEGVETPEQLDRLRALGYPAAQGHHLGRPMPADEFGTLLRTLTMASG